MALADTFQFDDDRRGDGDDMEALKDSEGTRLHRSAGYVPDDVGQTWGSKPSVPPDVFIAVNLLLVLVETTLVVELAMLVIDLWTDFTLYGDPGPQEVVALLLGYYSYWRGRPKEKEAIAPLIAPSFGTTGRLSPVTKDDDTLEMPWCERPPRTLGKYFSSSNI